MKLTELKKLLNRIEALHGSNVDVALSVDVSTGDHDAHARVFADFIGDTSPSGNRIVLLCEKTGDGG